MNSRPKSFLTCILAGFPLILGGCYPYYHADTTIFEQRQGQIISHQTTGERQRYNFQYEYDRTCGCYTIQISAPFTPRITLRCYANRLESLSLEVMGYKYFGAEAQEALNEYLPDFPWEQLPSLIQGNGMTSSHWAITRWENGCMDLDHKAGNKIRWIEGKA